MQNFIKPFLIFVVLYHLFVTIIWFGVFWWAYPQLPALGRDAIWVLFFAYILLANRKKIKGYLMLRKRPRISLITIIIFGTIISLSKGKWRYDIFVGIKYGLLYLFIFLSSTFIGYLWSKKSNTINNESCIWKFINFLKYFLIISLTFGFLRQGTKFLWPDIFLHMGYWPLNDFKFWVKPPIYYLTWYKGTPRRQWIFAWPNNYGYFLIAFLPAILYFFRQKKERIKDIRTNKKTTIIHRSLIILWIIAILLTLSRTAFIWGIIGIACINIQRIKQHKKLAIIVWFTALAGLIGLSVLKWASTLGHITAKFWSIKYVIQQPSGYGLGTSWPAVHQNGTILPENYYLQLILDIGTIGFLLRAICIAQITKIARKIQQRKKDREITNEENTIYTIWKWLTIGRLCLLIMGMFLHVFEDSMVNYIFFISRGILMGYLSTKIDKSLAIKW